MSRLRRQLGGELERLGGHRAQPPATLVDAVEARIGELARRRVLARGLSQRPRSTRARRAGRRRSGTAVRGPRPTLQPPLLRLAHPGVDPAEHEAGLEQASGLAAMDPLERSPQDPRATAARLRCPPPDRRSCRSSPPPRRPPRPLARAPRVRRAAGSRARHSSAWLSSASPARIASASSNCLCAVGRPRRRSSSSSAGRSSWTRLKVWIISIAAAAGSSAWRGAPMDLAAEDDQRGPHALAAGEHAVAHRRHAGAPDRRSPPAAGGRACAPPRGGDRLGTRRIRPR